MNKQVLLFLYLGLINLGLFAQGGSDATIISDSDRSVEPAFRMRVRPTLFDTLMPSPETKYPLLVLQHDTNLELQEIEPAIIRHRPQLNPLYKGYAKVGAGNRLMGLGEVYFNSTRSRKYNWGVHALHFSEWGQIPNYAPSQYDRTKGTVFGSVQEKRYSFGGEVNYTNHGLNYYGFQNPNASRDSIAQRFNSFDFSGYYASHPKDSAALNYRVGLDYNYFFDKKPQEDTLSAWRSQEHFIAARSTWQYKSSNNVLLSNMRADANVFYNDYRYGISDSTLVGLDSGIVSQNTIIQLRPTTHFYSKNEKFQIKFGVEFDADFHDGASAYLFPVGKVSYSLFNDLFIPYIGIDGGLKQQRFAHLAGNNEFIRSNQQLQNMQQLEFNFGIKGTLSKRINFNLGASFYNNRNMVLFVNDTLYSAGNQFAAIYDTISIASIMGSLSYQHSEKLKIDGIMRFNSYQARNNPYAWNLPELEFILRGKYNVVNKLIVNLDFILETGRKGQVFDASLPNTTVEDGVLVAPLGVIADANLGLEYRYTPRISFFGNLNNFAAQRYQRWFNYPVQGFQFMLGATFRF